MFSKCDVGSDEQEYWVKLQIIEGHPYNSSVDWFSFGVVLFEMLAGRLPFDGLDEDEMFRRIVHDQPKYPKHLKADAISIIHLVSTESWCCNFYFAV